MIQTDLIFLITVITFILITTPTYVDSALITNETSGETHVEGEWIFLFNKDLHQDWLSNFTQDEDLARLSLLIETSGDLYQQFNYSTNNTAGFSGFKLNLTDAEVEEIEANLTRSGKDIFRYITRNSVYKIQEQTCGQHITNFYNLPRLNVNNSYFVYPSEAGTNVDVYVLDTGISTDHPDFGGRAVFGFDFTHNASSQVTVDDNGHGTNVAGIVGSNTYGVAKNSRMIGVKVLDEEGSGLTFDIINAMAWVLGQRQANGRPAIVNLSLGGVFSSGLNAVTEDLIALGVPVVVAAGNEAANACNSSPSSVANAVTVTAFDQNSRMASFSNYGTCVDVFAPGVAITSLSHVGTGTSVLSGTSQACPHVAGILAIYQSQSLAQTGTELTPAQLTQMLLDDAQNDGVVPPVTIGTPNVVAQIPCTGAITSTLDSTGNSDIVSLDGFIVLVTMFAHYLVV